LRTLKQGHTFAVFDRRGDIISAIGSTDGIYHHDTRYLSHLELRLDDTPLLLLSSNVQEDNAVLSVDLTNPAMVSPQLHGELIHVNRLKFIWNSACYERIIVRNFDVRPHNFKLSVRFGADFADLFEVRGRKRTQRGQSSCELQSGASVALQYRGLDRIERITTLTFEPTPIHLDTTMALFELSLAPTRGTRVVLRIACDQRSPDHAVARRFYTAFRTSRRALRDSSGRAASIDSSNSLFNEMARRSVADLYMLITDTEYGPYPFAGLPWFSTPFGRDGLLTALFTLWLDPAIARGVLRFLAATQATEIDPDRDAEPGKILHEMRQGEMAGLGEVPFARYYGSIDSTPLFVLLAGEYFNRTGDLETAQVLWPHMLAALSWIDTYGDRDGDGFVEYHRQNVNGLVNQGWKDSNDAIFHADGRIAAGPIALCEVQGYVYAAKRHAAALASALGHPGVSRDLLRQAETLREKFEAEFWCEDLSTYALALDGAKEPCRVVASNAGHALWSGIADAARARRVANTLLGAACFSGWGVRTVAVSAPRYNPMSYHNGSVWPHDNALIALGFARYGLQDGVVKIFRGLFEAAGYMDLRRLPELFCGFPSRKLSAPTLYPVACIPQAWASAAVFGLIQASFGIGFDQQTGEIRFDRPILPGFLDHIQLRQLKTKRGSADILLRRYDSDVALNITRRQGDVPILVLQ
jgi:glycogen debranching enzyme